MRLCGVQRNGDHGAVRNSAAKNNAVGIKVSDGSDFGSSQQHAHRQQHHERQYPGTRCGTETERTARDDSGAFGVLINGNDNEFPAIPSAVPPRSPTITTRTAAPSKSTTETATTFTTMCPWTTTASPNSGGKSSGTADGNTYRYNLIRSTCGANCSEAKGLIARGRTSSFGPTNGTVFEFNTVYLTGAVSQAVVCHATCPSSTVVRANILVGGQELPVHERFGLDREAERPQRPDEHRGQQHHHHGARRVCGGPANLRLTSTSPAIDRAGTKPVHHGPGRAPATQNGDCRPAPPLMSGTYEFDSPALLTSSAPHRKPTLPAALACRRIPADVTYLQQPGHPGETAQEDTGTTPSRGRFSCTALGTIRRTPRMPTPLNQSLADSALLTKSLPLGLLRAFVQTNAADDGLTPQLLADLKILARTPGLLVACNYGGTLCAAEGISTETLPLGSAAIALRALAALPNTHAAVISGRSLRDLAAVSRLPAEVHLVGSHGAEFDMGYAHGLSLATESVLQQASQALAETVGAYRGISIERKPVAVSVHTRPAAPDVVAPGHQAGRGDRPGARAVLHRGRLSAGPVCGGTVQGRRTGAPALHARRQCRPLRRRRVQR